MRNLPTPRFSLRAMFVLFTIVAVYFGWNVHKVQQRTALLASIAECDVSCVSVPRPSPSPTTSPAIIEKVERMLVIFQAENTFAGGDFKQYPPSAPHRVSKLRQWLGDKPQWLIVYSPGPDPDLVRRLFPETIVVVGKRKTIDPWEAWLHVRRSPRKTVPDQASDLPALPQHRTAGQAPTP